MVRHMSSPPNTLLVRYAMRPIPAKIKENKAQGERPPFIGHPPRHHVIEEKNESENTNFRYGTHYDVAYSNRRRSPKIFRFITVLILPGTDTPFQKYKGKHYRG